MNIRSHRAGRKAYIGFLKENKIPHSVVYTNRTFKVISKLGTRVFMSGEISRRGLGFMQKVYNHVKHNLDALQHLNKDYEKLGLDRMVFRQDMKPGKHEGIIEVDMDKAYWSAAHKLKIIPEDIYNTGLEKQYKKVELLACLGGLAKDKRTREYDGTRYSKSTMVTDSKDTRFLWDAISFEVDKAMKDCAKAIGKDFFFYWTDAIIFKNTKANISAVESTLKKHGFSGKQIALEYLVNDPERKRVLVFSKENKSKSQKPLRDAADNYGRIFTNVTGHDKAQLIKRVKSFMRRKQIVKKIIKSFENE